MAYEKLKEESYDNTGGINEKSSKYQTGPNQFLDIRNYGFERPGALTSRSGTADFASLALATYLIPPKSMYQFISGSGSSFVVFDVGPTLFYLSSPPVAFAQSLTANVTTSASVDFVTANNKMYFANGRTFQNVYLSAPTLISSLYSIPQAGGWYGPGAARFVTTITGLIDYSATYIINPGTYAFRYTYIKDGVLGEPTGTTLTGIGGLLYYYTAATIATNGWYVSGYTNAAEAYGVGIIMQIKRPGQADFFTAPSNLDTTQYNYPEILFEDFNFDTEYQTIPHFTLVPQYLETYKNMLFMGGFSSQTSNVWYSDLGAPYQVQLENFVEIRTDNGDVITNMITFQDTLVVFKNNSVHEINGDAPQNLSLKNMTHEYGCVNSTGAVTFENKLWFCDQKGICEYNGPNTFIVSYAVEQKLSLVDKSKCRAFHVKDRNEVWFCFGNECFVFDYDVNAWTIYDRLEIQNNLGAALIQAGATTPAINFISTGSSFTSFTRFDDSLNTDRGLPITLLIQSRYHKRLGESTQEIWRRLFLDIDTNGTTLGCTVSFLPNYDSDVSLTRGFSTNQFQNRLDFGLSAKSMSFKWVIQASTAVTVNGYTVESRFLRSV